MMLTPANKSTGAEAVSGRPYAGIIGNEGGFILAFSMFMLAICMVLGAAAMNSSVYETDISANELIVKRTFVLAESGLPLAAIPLLTTGGKGGSTWPSFSGSLYLNDTNPLLTATSGVIQITDKTVLKEQMDVDQVYGTGWNNADKYLNAPSANKAAYKPLDDPFQKRNAAGALYDATIDNTTDIQIRSGDLIINVDVDWIAKTPLNSAEFAAGSEGQAYKLIYNMDCKATLPGKDITKGSSPVSETMLGYRLIIGSSGGI